MCAWENVIPCRRFRRVPPTPKQWKLGPELQKRRCGAGIGLFPHGVERARDGEEHYKGRGSRGRGTGSIQRKNSFTGRLIHSKCGHLFCGFLQRGLVMVLCVRVWERKRVGSAHSRKLLSNSSGLLRHYDPRGWACARVYVWFDSHPYQSVIVLTRPWSVCIRALWGWPGVFMSYNVDVLLRNFLFFVLYRPI